MKSTTPTSAARHYQSLQYSDVDNFASIAQPAWNELAIRVGCESEQNWTVTASSTASAADHSAGDDPAERGTIGRVDPD